MSGGSELLQIAANAVHAKLIGGSRQTRLHVGQLLSYEVEGADRNELFRAGKWDGRSSFFDFRAGLFPAGFVHMVGRELTRLGHRVQFAVKPAPPPLGPAVGSFDPLGYGFHPDYDYQPDTVRRLLRHQRLVAMLATGAGKSNVAVLATHAIRRPTLFLTTRSVLAYQMKEAFEASGITPGFMGDGVWAPRKGVNIALCQTLSARLEKNHPKRDLTLALLSYFEFVIGEEAHEAGGTSYYDILTHCRNAQYRLALTATPFMRPDGEANMRLQAAFGSIGIQVSEKTLIDRGILATPSFKLLSPPSPPALRRTTRWPTCYDLGVVENAGRHRMLVAEAVRASAHGLSSMILVQRGRHGEALRAMLDQAGVRAAFIFGKHEQEERKQALRDLAARSLDVLIGSTILDVGVDVPAVGFVGIAGAGKAEVGHRQRIGRGLRRKKNGPNVCFIADFLDEGNRYLHEHALMRRTILENTPGFADRILKPSEDYPYHLFNGRS